MVTMHYFVFIVLVLLSINNVHSQVTFELLCTADVRASGLSSLDGNDEFEIEFYEGKFLPDDTIFCKKIKFF